MKTVLTTLGISSLYWQVAQGKSRLKATLSKKTLIMLWLRDNSDRHYREIR